MNDKKSLYEKKLQRSNHKKRHQEFFEQLSISEDSLNTQNNNNN